MPSENSGGGGMCCVRVSLIIFNAITLLAGLATLGIGLWLVFQKSGGNDADIVISAGEPSKYLLDSGDLKIISVLLLSVGALVTFVSLIGCTGACVKSRCLLMSYLLTVVLILTIQLLAAVCVFLYREPIADALHESLMADLKNSDETNPENAVKRNWDVMQHHIQCCGVDRFSDWYDLKAWPGRNFVPDSCCIVANVTTNLDGCGRNETPSTWYKQGCLEKLKGAILEQLHVLASIVITLIFLQLYGIIASILLFFHSKTPKQKSPQYKAYLYERAARMYRHTSFLPSPISRSVSTPSLSRVKKDNMAATVMDDIERFRKRAMGMEIRSLSPQWKSTPKFKMEEMMAAVVQDMEKSGSSPVLCQIKTEEKVMGLISGMSKWRMKTFGV